ncbi:nucleoplasmin-3 isoform X1 [Melozone crissalis]|uniref:nucleoplasmin-3 isoform X1 n=1 Tax=Melozone crissalis TaxID=40204 RepID=UPI0023DC433A|nr:nucleoplasmin-3 isoform X1 [Melozone crissalis]
MEPHGPACPGSVLFGCELTASTKSYTFQVDEEDNFDHILSLSTVCLTDGAKDECNVVEVVGRNHENQEIAVPVANLKLSCQPLLSLDNFKLQPPVTFRLAAGSGPVHLAGWHRISTHWDFSPWMIFTLDTSSHDLNICCFFFFFFNAVLTIWEAEAAPSTEVSPFTQPWEGDPKTGWLLLVYPLSLIPVLGAGDGGGDPYPVPFCCPGLLLCAPPFPGCETLSPGPMSSRWV